MEKEERKRQTEEIYFAPDFEVVEIEFEQHILQGGSGEAPDYYGEDY